MMNIQLRPTQALATQFVLPEAPTIKTKSQQLWQRRAIRIGHFDLVLKHEPVMELLRNPAIYPLPFAPSACAGLINRRGSLIPIFDWLGDFGVAPQEQNFTNILVLGSDTDAVAIAITEVLEQLSEPGGVSLSRADVQDLPPSIRRAITGIIQRQGKLYFQLDHEALLGAVFQN